MIAYSDTWHPSTKAYARTFRRKDEDVFDMESFDIIEGNARNGFYPSAEQAAGLCAEIRRLRKIEATAADLIKTVPWDIAKLSRAEMNCAARLRAALEAT